MTKLKELELRIDKLEKHKHNVLTDIGSLVYKAEYDGVKKIETSEPISNNGVSRPTNSNSECKHDWIAESHWCLGLRIRCEKCGEIIEPRCLIKKQPELEAVIKEVYELARQCSVTQQMINPITMCELLKPYIKE